MCQLKAGVEESSVEQSEGFLEQVVGLSPPGSRAVTGPHWGHKGAGGPWPSKEPELHPQDPSQQDQNLIYSLGVFLLYKSNHELFFHIVNIVLNSCSWAIRLQASPGELSASTFGGPLAAL